MNFKQWRDDRKQKQKQRNEEELQRFVKGEPPRSLEELGHRRFLELASNPRAHVVTCPEGVLAYTIEPKGSPSSQVLATFMHNTGFSAMDEKIKEIFAANPDVDFKGLQEALGIKVLNQQSKAKSKPDAKEDWFI